MSIPLTLHAQSFGPLGKVEWPIPAGVSAIVGPNRVGKSTLLALPEFIATAIHENLNEAVKRVFDGPAYLRTFGQPNMDPSVGMSYDDCKWNIDITIKSGAIAPYSGEYLQSGDNVVLVRKFGSAEGECDGRIVTLGERLIPAVCVQYRKRIGRDEFWAAAQEQGEMKELSPLTRSAVRAGTVIAAYSRLFLVYRTYKYEIQHLMKFGSVHSDSTTLDAAGGNVFPLLRNWRDSSETEARFEFVMSVLREAFPHFSKVDFEQAGQTVTMAIRDRRWPDRKVPISRESTGFVTALIQLCAVVSTPGAGFVTLDEIETSLHPHAIRVLVAAFRRWAKEHDIHIVLATQSQTVLDQFHDEPHQVHVIEPGQETSPRALTDLFEGDYLNQFSLGDLFSHLEFGSNREQT